MHGRLNGAFDEDERLRQRARCIEEETDRALELQRGANGLPDFLPAFRSHLTLSTRFLSANPWFLGHEWPDG